MAQLNRLAPKKNGAASGAAPIRARNTICHAAAVFTFQKLNAAQKSKYCRTSVEALQNTKNADYAASAFLA